jgi:hypothetical protein
MSSRFPCAAGITAKFIDMATKRLGGQRLALAAAGYNPVAPIIV